MELYSNRNQYRCSINAKSRNTIQYNGKWCSIPVLRNLFWSWNVQRYDRTKNHHHNVGDGFYKCLYAIAALLISTPAYAEGDTPITAVANPQATSSGSVTNQAVQVLQGPYVTNSYGGGVSCQGPTFNITPFVTTTNSGQYPFESYANLDNDLSTPPERTGQKDNWAKNFGMSATISFPLDGGLQARCKKAADTWIKRQQAEADKARLDFELVRLLRCGESMKAGVRFHPQSPYAKICADVVVIPPNDRAASSIPPSGPSKETSSPSYSNP